MPAMNHPDSPDQPPRPRCLPSVDHLLHQPAIESLLADYPRNEVVHVVRAVLDERRQLLLSGQAVEVDVPSLALAVRQRLYQRARPNLRKVINATGIILHTGLGRAPLPEEAIAAIAEVAAGYCNLELNLQTGRRGDRHQHLRELFQELCGVEDALVVNNNAAATYLTLNTLAAGREVIISRGQLIEIGGSYRLPDIMAAAQCRMVEVGTTNRTRIADYERAISDRTSVLLRVHPSNYRIHGFAESAALGELVELARRHNLVVVDDLGSGLITDELPWPETKSSSGYGEVAAPISDWARGPALETAPSSWNEPNVRASVAAGADLILFSGDKLLGGPQAGIILGRAELIAGLRKNPLARTFRPGKLTLAGLEATLRLYRDPAVAVRRIPVYRMLARTLEELERAAHQLAQRLSEVVSQATVFVEADWSEAGGGSLPDRPFPTWIAGLRPDGLAAQAIADALRRRDLPIICRLREDALIFDPRTLEPDELEQIPGAVAEVMRELAEG